MPHRHRRSIVAAREALREAKPRGLSTREISDVLREKGIPINRNLTTTLSRAVDVYSEQAEKGARRIWFYGKRVKKDER